MYKIEYKAKRKITIELNIFLPVSFKRNRINFYRQK